MISFLLTAWKEEKTVGKAIECLVDSAYSGYVGEFELLLVAPDDETLNAAKRAVSKLGCENKFQSFKDKCIGKPAALNILFSNAKGDYLVLTDGEVFFEKGAVLELYESLINDKSLGGVCGRPIATNERSSYFGYLANMNADAVHKMRTDSLKKKPRFFPLSGYIFIVKNLGFKFPEDLFLDDAYLSYSVLNQGYEIGYNEKAKVGVKYPGNWKDFRAQKFRSMIGFEQLWKYKIINEKTKRRSFASELSMATFPILYAKNPKELLFSISYYPIRLYFWVMNRLKRDLAYKAKSIRDVYVRTESTK